MNPPAAGRGPVRHGLVIFATFVRLGMLNLMAYRAEFGLALLNVAIGLASQALGLSVIFSQTTQLGGWTVDQVLILIGVQFILAGFLGMVIRPSMSQLMEGIRLGTFDFTLTKPADSQLLASTQVFSPAAVTELAIGAGVVVVGCVRLGETITLASVGLFALTLLCGLVMFVSVLMLLSTLSFWFVKLSNILAIFESVFGQAGRWPITIFPRWLRFTLTFVIPIGFAVTVPAQALTGKLDGGTVGLAMGIAAAFFIASRLFWKFALRHYTGASA